MELSRFMPTLGGLGTLKLKYESKFRQGVSLTRPASRLPATFIRLWNFINTPHLPVVAPAPNI